MVAPIKKELSLAELRQQQEEIKTQIEKMRTTERANRLDDHLQKLADVVTEQRELGLGYIPIVRLDIILRDILQKQGNKQTAQQVNEAVGPLIRPLLDPNEDSLIFIQNTLAERSKTVSDTEKDKDGKFKKLRPLFKHNADGTYSVAE